MNLLGILKFLVTTAITCYALYKIGWQAADIRMHAIRVYGMVIHEFDPWFNFRAAQYLADNGWTKFFTWFDYMSWSPLGRPVGTTIYPGMQIASVAIWNVMRWWGVRISLNDVCCMTPVYFGVVATMTTGALTYVCTGSIAQGVFASAVVSIIPAHIMRSVGGGYDNESVAISCLLLTFLCWCYSLCEKDGNKWSYFGIVTGLLYTCMVATWGGFIFVLNMIGLHAAVLILIGRYSKKLYWSYTLWYLVGTIGATHVPPVGWTPLKSLEQLAPLGVFLGMQVIYLLESPAFLRWMKYDPENMTVEQKVTVYLKVGGVCATALAIVIGALWPTGYFGPLSSRIRGLFVRHTRTGNPLVDSVAEHQPANPNDFDQFLHWTAIALSPYGFAIVVFRSLVVPLFKPAYYCKRSDAATFIVVYASVTYYFATKMNRLMLLMGPVASILCGVALGSFFDFIMHDLEGIAAFVGDVLAKGSPDAKPAAEDKPLEDVAAAAAASSSSTTDKDGKDKKKKEKEDNSNSRQSKRAFERELMSSKPQKKKAFSLGLGFSVGDYVENLWTSLNATKIFQLVRKVACVLGVLYVYTHTPEFVEYSKEMARNLSNPSLMFQARTHDGKVVMIDDYREAYHWLRDQTPRDSRVMAWWDYGYQITGIGNRTSIADGNTWNHEHIALLGKCLTSPEADAHMIIKHLADYVLLWTGGGADDLAKSPHMARITNSVFENTCPNDPTCRMFGFVDSQLSPTPMMAKSLLYKLHQYRIRQGVTVDGSMFQEVFMSKYGKVRIYKVLGVQLHSKEWAASPANRPCDRPGSWYCTGQYPPALKPILRQRKNFRQLEDFNNKNADDEASRKYHEEYMKKMGGH